MPYGNRDNENTFGKEREAYTAIDRPENYRADTSAYTGKKEVSCPGTDRQIPPTGKKRTRTHLHAVGPGTGDMQSSRPEQAAGGVLQQIERIRLFTL